MTRDEKLDTILSILLSVDVKKLKNELINKPITMDFLNWANTDLELVDWEMKSLKDELLNEELAIEKNGEIQITQKGKKFITKEKGFKNLAKVSLQDEIIREETIKKFRYDKFAFWFSIIAIIISVIGFFVT